MNQLLLRLDLFLNRHLTFTVYRAILRRTDEPLCRSYTFDIGQSGLRSTWRSYCRNTGIERNHWKLTRQETNGNWVTEFWHPILQTNGDGYEAEISTKTVCWYPLPKEIVNASERS